MPCMWQYCMATKCHCACCMLAQTKARSPQATAFIRFPDAEDEAASQHYQLFREFVVIIAFLVATCVASTLQDCGAVSLDSTGKDISSSIIAVDVTPCSTSEVCPACDISFAAAGLCLPGSYLYLYRYCNCLTPKTAPVSSVHFAEGKLGLGGIQHVCLGCASCSASVTVLLVPNVAQSPGQLCSAGFKLTTGAGASSSALVSPFTLSVNLITSV